MLEFDRTRNWRKSTSIPERTNTRRKSTTRWCSGMRSAEISGSALAESYLRGGRAEKAAAIYADLVAKRERAFTLAGRLGDARAAAQGAPADAIAAYQKGRSSLARQSSGASSSWPAFGSMQSALGLRSSPLWNHSPG